MMLLIRWWMPPWTDLEMEERTELILSLTTYHRYNKILVTAELCTFLFSLSHIMPYGTIFQALVTQDIIWSIFRYLLFLVRADCLLIDDKLIGIDLDLDTIKKTKVNRSTLSFCANEWDNVVIKLLVTV